MSEYVKKQKDYKFVLPEKWAVKVTKENINIINDYRNSFNVIDNFDLGTYQYAEYQGYGLYEKNLYKGYKEITFEEFEKYVLLKDIIINDDMSHLIKLFKKLKIK